MLKCDDLDSSHLGFARATLAHFQCVMRQYFSAVVLGEGGIRRIGYMTFRVPPRKAAEYASEA